ncbi:MAG: hypothetical protein AB7N91_02955 [Candidatus Tectimicrobiota bacterium]
MPISLQWEGRPAAVHLDTIETAQALYDFIPQARQRIQGGTVHALEQQTARVTPLATGGGMAVYTVRLPGTEPLVCKIPHQRRIVYTTETSQHTSEETTRQLLDRLVELADHLAQRAPGLFPRSGGAWHWQSSDGTPRHLLVEEFIPGLSVERLKLRYEQAWLEDTLSAEHYTRCRIAAERLAIATFVRLWDALDRRLFTSDPSPWNILVQQPDTDLSSASAATIIDLHGLEDGAGLAYVVQRLAAVYGMREDIVEQVLLPGVCDALGETTGVALLRAELPQLEAEAARLRQNLGVDMQQPLLRALHRLL